MKFGLFFEQGVTLPSSPEKLSDVFATNVEQVLLAERLGFDQVWMVEHNCLEGYASCVAPETFLGYLAAVTSTIRLGHGIRVLLPEIGHPARAAAMAAYLDVLSDGRLEFGTGRQFTFTEMGALGVQPDTTKEVWEEVIRAIPRMWTERDFSTRGKYLSMPARPVVPKPLQQPHPPIWVAVQSPDTAKQAGERGLGFLGVSFTTPEKYAVLVAQYHDEIKTCSPVGKFVNNQVNAVTYMYCGETAQDVEEVGVPAMATFFRTAGNQIGVGSIYPTTGYPASATAGTAVAPEPDDRPDMPLGTPERCIEAIKRWEGIGIDRMIFLIEYQPRQKSLDSLKLFAREVMPEFDPDGALAAEELLSVTAGQS